MPRRRWRFTKLHIDQPLTDGSAADNNKNVSLYERFELLDLDRDDGVKTFAAREISTGRPVKVHLFVRADAPIQVALLKAIDRLPDAERPRIIERGKHDGTPYVVTDRLADYPGLSEWVQATGHAAKPKKPALEIAGAWKLPAQPVAPPPAASPKPGAPSSLNQQFAELFPTAERPILPPETVLQPPPPAPKAPPPAAPVLANEPTHQPGEFTRMFQAPAAPVKSPAAPPPAGIVSVAPAAPAKKEPGEFTRMFQAPAAPPPPPSPASPSGPSDFERFFETPAPAGPMPQSPAVQQPLTPQAPGGSGHNKAGEFTRMFGKAGMAAPPAAPAAPPSPQEPGEFTRMFQAPAVPMTQPGVTTPAAPSPPPVSGPAPNFSAPAPSPVPPPAVPKASGPGEYTRQFSAPAQLTFGQTSATPPFRSQGIAGSPMAAAPAPLAPKKTNLVLILGIVGMVVVAALIVVFFAMRPK
jgi:hypothetical protein